MKAKIIGAGSALGGTVVSNADLGEELGIGRDWFERHTGIRSRRICSENETAFDLAVLAIERCLEDAGLSAEDIGAETVLIHIHNGLADLTPPSGIRVASSLGLERVRVLSIDGVCAEPIPATEVADLMIRNGRCERAIISASADFIGAVNVQDQNTAGLFGAGAGAILVGAGDGPVLDSVYWESVPKHVGLGVIPVTGAALKEDGSGATVDLGFYEMNGTGLLRAGLKHVPRALDKALLDAQASKQDIDLIISHQPNVRMIEALFKAFKLDLDKTPMPVVELGNMGPASILVTYDMAKKAGQIADAKTILLIGFGLGLSYGAAILRNE